MPTGIVEVVSQHHKCHERVIILNGMGTKSVGTLAVPSAKMPITLILYIVQMTAVSVPGELFLFCHLSGSVPFFYTVLVTVLTFF